MESTKASDTEKTAAIGGILALLGFVCMLDDTPSGWPLLVSGVVLLAGPLFGGFERKEGGG
jgi:hypothetical protein